MGRASERSRSLKKKHVFFGVQPLTFVEVKTRTIFLHVLNIEKIPEIV